MSTGSNSDPRISSKSRWKVTGAEYKPKGITRNSNNPFLETVKAVGSLDGVKFANICFLNQGWKDTFSWLHLSFWNLYKNDKNRLFFYNDRWTPGATRLFYDAVVNHLFHLFVNYSLYSWVSEPISLLDRLISFKTLNFIDRFTSSNFHSSWSKNLFSR